MYAEIDVADPVVVSIRKENVLCSLHVLTFDPGIGRSRHKRQTTQSSRSSSADIKGISAVMIC
jgi:hypothetical protein